MTAAERKRMRKLVEIGCIVCRMQSRGYVPPAIHHIVSGGKRLGEIYTIPLCDPGHHQNAPKESGEVSRHPGKAAFEKRYGLEAELLEITNKYIEAMAKG